MSMSMSKKPVFSGTTKECLAHFMEASLHGDKRLALSDFTKVTLQTVRRWNKHFPVGEVLIKLRVYLDLHGYKVAELERLDPVIREIAAIVAFEVCPISNILELLGLPLDTKNGNSQLLSALRGERKYSPERVEKLRVFALRFKETLKEVADRTPILRAISSEPSVTLGSKESKSNEVFSREVVASVGHEMVIKSFAAHVNAMLPLAKLIVSDSFSPTERQKLRESVGGNGVFKLSRELNRLCGEQARDKFKQQQQ